MLSYRIYSSHLAFLLQHYFCKISQCQYKQFNNFLVFPIDGYLVSSFTLKSNAVASKTCSFVVFDTCENFFTINIQR